MSMHRNKNHKRSLIKLLDFNKWIKIRRININLYHLTIYFTIFVDCMKKQFSIFCVYVMHLF